MDLRPLTLAELLDRAFSTYRHHLWLFVGIMAVPAIWSITSAVAMEVVKALTTVPGAKPGDAPLQIALLLIGSFLFGIVYLLAYAFALGATTVAVSHLYMVPQHVLLFAVPRATELTATAARVPADARDMYRVMAAQELVERRAVLLGHLRQRGALAVEVPSAELAPAVVDRYLGVKERNLL